MSSREARKQRREAERKAKNLAYKQERAAVAAAIAAEIPEIGFKPQNPTRAEINRANSHRFTKRLPKWAGRLSWMRAR